MELAAILQLAITILGLNVTMQLLLWVDLKWQGRQKEEHHRELLIMVYKLAKLQMRSSRGAAEALKVLGEIEEEEVKLLSSEEVTPPGLPAGRSDAED